MPAKNHGWTLVVGGVTIACPQNVTPPAVVWQTQEYLCPSDTAIQHIATVEDRGEFSFTAHYSDNEYGDVLALNGTSVAVVLTFGSSGGSFSFNCLIQNVKVESMDQTGALTTYSAMGKVTSDITHAEVS
jgi:hypothetical protein